MEEHLSFSMEIFLLSPRTKSAFEKLQSLLSKSWQKKLFFFVPGIMLFYALFVRCECVCVKTAVNLFIFSIHIDQALAHRLNYAIHEL